MTSEKKRIYIRRINRVGITVIILIVLFYFLWIVPHALFYQHALQSLRPEQVQSLRVHTESLSHGAIVKDERVLHGAEISDFLSLVSVATLTLPNRPRGGQMYFVDIDTTTDYPHFSFQIHATGNNKGVLLNLFSDPSGRKGWNYGNLRNDALKSFLESQFHDVH